jgi:signal transduction histidine kinase
MQGLGPAAEAKGVQLIASMDTEALRLNGDARRLQQVLWNLVHNAIKFTPKDGRVEIRVGVSEGHLQLSVQDNGQGILPSFLPHVFEKFRQQDSSTTRATFGLGLGLSIVKQIVELHGGTVHAMSAGEGLGATFIARIPTNVAAAARPAASGLAATTVSQA